MALWRRVVGEPEQRRGRRLPRRLLLWGLLLGGLALRLLRLDFQPLWWDEGYSVWFAGQSLAEMARLTAADIHPPLYYTLLHLWVQVLGLAPITLRLFSVVVGLPAILLAYLLGRDLADRRTGLLAAALVAINPLAVFYSQEIRMYGLAATLSLAALWTGWRWVQPEAPRRFGVAYGLTVLAGFYTLYTFALLPAAQLVWVLAAARRQWRRWLAALLPALALYLPWILYAGPQLLNYVAYKVVQDNDTPLALLPYWGHHLSAFLVGHLEGALANLWAWLLLLMIPPAAALLLAVSRPGSSSVRRDREGTTGDGRALGYLLLALALPVAVGFIQQLRAPFLPERFERVLLFAAPAFWLLLALGLRRLAQEALLAALLVGGLLLLAVTASLSAFYTIPRYTERDYRPLIRTFDEHFDAERDHVFAIYPWQVGYFWVYSQNSAPPGRIPAWLHLAPQTEWGPVVQQTLDELLHRGGVWFPEHLSLGGILEGEVERYLDQRGYQMLNRWFGTETRLAGWAADGISAAVWQDAPAGVAWQNGVRLETARLTPGVLSPEINRLFMDLAWAGDRAIQADDLVFSLWLMDSQSAFRWAQRDVTPFAHPWPPLATLAGSWRNRDRLVLTIPTGTPPGDYDLWAALLDRNLTPIPLAGANPALQVWLGTVTVPLMSAAFHLPGQLAVAAPMEVAGAGPDTGLGFAGYTLAAGPHLPGDDLAIDLFWSASGPLAPDHHVFVQLLDEGGGVAAGWEGPPIAWHPTSQWVAGATLRSQHRLRVPALLPPGRYPLIAGLFIPGSGERVTWQGRDHVRLGWVEVGARSHSFQSPAAQVVVNVAMAGGHRLAGYDLVAGSTPGSPINLTLYWAPAGATERRYRVFVHLLAADDTILDQSDAEPAHGVSPTTSWLAGEFVSDSHVLTLPLDEGAGPYRLALGLYDPITGERLPFVDAAGAVVSDHLVLPLGE